MPDPKKESFICSKCQSGHIMPELNPFGYNTGNVAVYCEELRYVVARDIDPNDLDKVAKNIPECPLLRNDRR